MPSRTICLLTDFGHQSIYAGQMKGAILNIQPDVQIVDLSHEVSPHNIQEAAFLLDASIPYFPVRTVFVVVVDPGVGSKRRPILAVGERSFYVGPDNGVLSLAYKTDSVLNVYEITEDHYFLKPLSSTFHGRDIFAPVAGWLTRGVDSGSFGELIEDPVQLDFPAPRAEGSKILGQVLHCDRFGNLLTNIPRRLVEHLMESYQLTGFSAQVEGLTTQNHVQYFSQVAPGTPVSLFGSLQNLEICVREGSAAERSGASVGSPVVLQFQR